MNRHLLITLVASLCLLSVGCAPAKYSPNILPRNTPVDASVKLPINQTVAVYIPKVYRDWGYPLKGSRKRVEAGKGLVSGVHVAGRKFFTNMKDFDPNSNDTFSLLLDLDPSWVAQGGKITFTFDYQLFNASHTIMHHGRESFTANIDMRSPETAVENAVIRASQKIYIDIVNTLQTHLEAPYTTARMSDVNGELLVNRNRNSQAFTTFKINKNGQLLSAGYALDGCVVAELETKTGTYNVTKIGQSKLLDISLLDTDAEFIDYVKFPSGTIEYPLGETISSLSFPWDITKTSPPVLSIGHVNADQGLEDSRGLFQFSSAVAPVAKGGLIVNQKGELIGMNTGRYLESWHARNDRIPKNVYFALKGDYIKKFLDKHDTDYSLNNKNLETNGIDSANTHSVKVNCYQ